VVIGPFNPRREALMRQCGDLGLEVVVAPPALLDLAADADMALTTLGMTASELAFMGVPNLAAAVDARQVPYLAAYEQLGFVSALGWHADLTPDKVARAVDELAEDPGRRQAMRQAGQALVDGNGAARIADAIVAAARERRPHP
jgi:spore coat polysaccharide biosynthesis predicted glycosyltransferase SpsG